MDHKSIDEIAGGYGLTIETDRGQEETTFKVYKGANQVFAGMEAEVRDFLTTYEADRPGLFEASMYGYRE